ncbi:hypothetical protein GDO81_024966 [Engystomops pustulosus]|uniref:Uncharacterized protein n=1 Tax=Engystomops pustulosus TaxID=76066 RepID=A0AAV6YT35_ENGPU|nr:hypothetical protein GDO81_024966 [Engystomops pustulosus]
MYRLYEGYRGRQGQIQGDRRAGGKCSSKHKMAEVLSWWAGVDTSTSGPFHYVSLYVVQSLRTDPILNYPHVKHPATICNFSDLLLFNSLNIQSFIYICLRQTGCGKKFID